MMERLRGGGFVQNAVIAAAAALIAYLGAFFLPKQYRSYATYYFPMSGARTTFGVGVNQPAGETTGSVSSLGGALVSPVIGSAPSTAANLLESFECRRGVVREVGLSKLWGVSEIEACDILGACSSINADQPGFLRLDVVQPDAELAQNIAQSYLNQLDALSKKLSLNVSKRNREFVESQVRAARERVNLLDKELAAVLGEGSISDPEKLVAEYIGTRDKLGDAEVAARSAGAKLESARDAMLRLYAAGTMFPIMSLLVPNLAAEMELRRLKLADAESDFQPGAPELQKAKESVKAIETLGAEIVQKRRASVSAGYEATVSALRAEKAGADEAASELRRHLNALLNAMKSTPSKYVRLEKTKRELRIAEQTLQNLEVEYQTALIAEARDPARFEVLDRPIADSRPVGPRKSLIALTAFLVVFAAISVLRGFGSLRGVSSTPEPR